MLTMGGGDEKKRGKGSEKPIEGEGADSTFPAESWRGERCLLASSRRQEKKAPMIHRKKQDGRHSQF